MDPLQPCQISLFSPVPPWKSFGENITTYYDYKETITNNDTFMNYISEKYPGHDHIFTDGSKINSPLSTACGIYIPSRPSAYSWKIDPLHTVLSSELIAIYQALIFSSFSMQTNHIILSDSKTALLLIKSLDPQSHQNMVFKIQRQLMFLNHTKSVSLHWVKGHMGILGNEKADRAANIGHSREHISFDVLPVPLTIHLSVLKTKFTLYWEDYWKKAVANTDTGKFLFNIRSGSIKKHMVIFNLLTRREQVLIQRLRIGHAGLQHYLHRFKIIQDDLCPHCSLAPETFEHFFYMCDAFDIERADFQQKLDSKNVNPITLKSILGCDPNLDNLFIIKAVISYLNDCGKSLLI